MYEEISIKKRIDWKSLTAKLIILLLIVFIICAIALSPKKTYAVTPLNSITKELIDAGKEYYTFENLPINIGEYKSITLASLIEKDYIVEKSFKTNNCSYDESYVKTTKVNAKEFSIYAKVICDKDEEVIVDTIKTKKDTKSSLNNDESFSIEVID